MKKKVKSETPKLSLDKETIARLNEEQLSQEQTQEIEGGATYATGGLTCCGGFTSC